MPATRVSLSELRGAAARHIVRDCATDLARTRRPTALRIGELRDVYLGGCAALPGKLAPLARLFCSILCDLRGQGWSISVRDDDLVLTPPAREQASPEERKLQVRNAHLLERDAQLMQPPTRRFIREMERRRRVGAEWHSIYSLMRNGAALAKELQAVLSVPAGSQRMETLRRTLDPYIEVVESDSVCRLTGLRLVDVWRYFRHTWTTPYFSTPGRRMVFLIRDRAAKNHPVIGIGALGSAIVQLAPRDAMIGWTPDRLAADLAERPTTKWAKWLDESLRSLIRSIHVRDLKKKLALTSSSLQSPSEVDIAKLRKLAASERKLHHLYPKRNLHKSTTIASDANWLVQAKTHLFTSKRAGTLADLLEARRQLQRAGFRKPNVKCLKAVLAKPSFKRAAATILRHVKAAHVGVDMMDITVCGAIPPYNALLGGKLVSLLLASPEVRVSYATRYANAVSVIASAMAGKPVRRRPNLVLLGTTSLYDVAPAQYNRLRVPAERAGGAKGDELRFQQIGQTAGFGSYHFSRSTMELIELVLARQQSGRPVNSIFGEGVNPKLRKVRGAMDLLGLPSDALLHHQSPRIIYAVPLAKNYREILLGLAHRPVPILPAAEQSTAAIVEFWRERWLLGRIEREQVLEDVCRHTLTYPIRHGARVRLPSRADERESHPTLFGEDPEPLVDLVRIDDQIE